MDGAQTSCILVEKLCEYLDAESQYSYEVRCSQITHEYTIRVFTFNKVTLVAIIQCKSYTDLIYTLCNEIIRYTQAPSHQLH